MPDSGAIPVAFAAPPVARAKGRRLASPLLRRILLVNLVPLALLCRRPQRNRGARG
jgi:hypothetical protein